ncbi:hypothetical protein [Flavobacterium sp. GT3R68]|uniref:hypothetical protein n=1 Tax=Flavobacterium sp. GT3R68 TaxID=2594437 RepID=UPI000F88CDF7|nr:hypothetical protein [Flavobacterium sp. GT3R68]RTY85831.1 hypothetical protein EKL32_28285 [Flavobacterium sp. GSN2]TRW89359.1 hypothetical protein FNW07_13380 [Flavobacterium sp. GT3R68]
MKYLILIITFLSLLSCKKSNEKGEFDSAKIKNINEIVETIIIEDSLNVLKSDKKSRMLCEDLIKINVYVPEKSKDGLELPPPPPSNNISINTLINSKIIEPMFFTSKDSTYLILQNSGIVKYRIDEKILAKVNFTSSEMEKTKRKIGKHYSFYEISLPLFSVDNNKAYVELGYYCGSLCGQGKAFFLEKINGKWKIIESFGTWIS